MYRKYVSSISYFWVLNCKNLINFIIKEKNLILISSASYPIFSEQIMSTFSNHNFGPLTLSGHFFKCNLACVFKSPGDAALK